MYAIVKTGGKQYRVAEGDVIEVEKLVGDPGDAVTLSAVLLVDGENLVHDEDRGQRDLVARRAGELLDDDHIALGDPVLLAAGLDDRVHGTRTPV